MELRRGLADFEVLFDRICNWERWGKDDERGALNYITNERRVAAARLVSTGETLSLALPLATSPAVDNPHPVHHSVIRAHYDSDHGAVPVCADYFAMDTHGTNTHLDALCHMFWRGKMYNGFDAREVGVEGAQRCGIDSTRDGIVGRAILLDIPKIKRVEWLEKDYAITAADLEAAEKDHNVVVGEGDIVLVRTGRVARRRAKGPWFHFTEGAAGMEAFSCLPWLHERKIAVCASDCSSDLLPSGVEGVVMPVHIGLIVAMGVHVIDHIYVEKLAAFCARAERYEFAFTLGALVLERGTGSPVNPVAIF